MGQFITLYDKQFKPFITKQQIAEAVKKVAGLIQQDFKNESPFFLVVLNGAFMFATDLMKEINMPCELGFMKTASYEGTVSKGEVDVLIGLKENVEGKSVVIIEDIVETGNTIQKIMDELSTRKAKQIKVASMLTKPKAHQHAHKIDYAGIEIDNDFVVGYGLDYKGLGRNLNEIYVLA